MSFTHTLREGNTVPDILAKHAKTNINPLVTLRASPGWMLRLIITRTDNGIKVMQSLGKTK